MLVVIPIKVNYQDMLISGASWARAKSKLPSFNFDRFWWSKVKTYDKVNQASASFWKTHDLTDTQALRQVFATQLNPVALDDIDDDEAVVYVLGEGGGVVGADGVLKVLKVEPDEGEFETRRRHYRVRVLTGDLPLVPFGPLIWGPVLSFDGKGSSFSLVSDEAGW